MLDENAGQSALEGPNEEPHFVKLLDIETSQSKAGRLRKNFHTSLFHTRNLLFNDFRHLCDKPSLYAPAHATLFQRLPDVVTLRAIRSK